MAEEFYRARIRLFNQMGMCLHQKNLLGISEQFKEIKRLFPLEHMLLLLLRKVLWKRGEHNVLEVFSGDIPVFVMMLTINFCTL